MLLQVQFSRVDLLSAAEAAAARVRFSVPGGYVDATQDVFANTFFERCGAVGDPVAGGTIGCPDDSQGKESDAELLAALEATSASGTNFDIDEEN